MVGNHNRVFGMLRIRAEMRSYLQHLNLRMGEKNMMRSELGIDIEHDVNIHLENRKESRYFFAFIWLLYAVVYMTKNCYNGAMAGIVEAGILTKSQTGLITSVFYLLYAPMQIVGGKAADKYSPEKLIKVGLIGAALANLVIYLNQNYYIMMGAWAFNAVIQFGVWPSVFKIISSQLVRSDRKTMIFYISFASSMGLLLSYIVAAVLPDWKMNFSVSAGALAAFAVGLHIYEKHLNPLMKWDRTLVIPAGGQAGEQSGMSTCRLFAASGFFVMVVVFFLRSIISQTATSLSPVMLMESYEDVPAYMGNLLNLLVVGAGIAGTLLMKLVLYPKYIRNESTGVLVTLLITFPCVLILRGIGNINIAQAVLSLCGVSLCSSAGTLLNSYFNANYAKYGKSGLAAGISNSFSAFGFMATSYGMLKISEVSGWGMVTDVWVVLVVLALVLKGVVVCQ